jgi:ubiquinone/menaquinone biosynthesis C-methylase UbiE
MRRRKVERFDTLHAATYDDDWGTVPATHETFVARFLDAVPPTGRVLDVACGTGRLFPAILATGRQVDGVDASAQMLAQARRKHPDVATTVQQLTDLTITEPYDGVMCVDALENLPPEDWPAALAALRRAVREGGPVYLTVEVEDPAAVERGNAEARAAGLPVVDGEVADTDGGYHYYPPRQRVLDWLVEAGLEVSEQADGDYYWHLLCRAGRPAEPAASTPATRSEATRPSVATLVTYAVAGAVGAVLLLLAAGTLGAGGLVIVAAVEAAVVYALYRWSPAP